MNHTIRDPDSLYDDKSDSVTFIYDPKKDKIYTGEFPEAHGDLQVKYPELNQYSTGNQKLIRAGFLLGRIGLYFDDPNDSSDQYEDDYDDLAYLHKDDQEPIKAIVFWNTEFENDDLTKCLYSLVRKFPLYNDPETIVLSDMDRTYDRRKGFKETQLKNLIHISSRKQNYIAKQHRPECDVTLDVKGIPTKLSDILGNFHMVKDDRLPAMKTAVCSQGPNLKKKLLNSKCDSEISMIDQLLQKAHCQKAGEYNSLKQGGRIARKQELQKIFADPEAISRNFRTQKELDAAWDELQGKKEHRMTGFIEWISKYSQS
jgi:hypothetical protein